MGEAEKYGGKLTFFVTGEWLVRDRQIIKLIEKRGHQIGNHSFSHPNLSRCSAQKVRYELGHTNDLIVQQGGTRPTFFRPPYGSHNAMVDKIAGELGMKVVMWDLDPSDWRASQSGAQTAAYVLRHARPRTVLLIHQIHGTFTVLEPIFCGLHQKGLTCVRLDALGRYPKGSSGQVGG
jgi:peptidoglycan-N-acetylglucosamine deacetylase